MKVYLAGKIGDRPDLARPKFEQWEQTLRAYGHEVVNPMKLPHAEGSEWEDYMAVDIAHMVQCDAVFLIEDWKDSPGARLECKIARYMGKKIIDGPNALPPVVMQIGLFV